MRRNETSDDPCGDMYGSRTFQSEASNEPKEFRRKLERYMDSTEQISDGQYWPLVKRVRMKGRKWKLKKAIAY
ncbi:hypothetical protein T484DRAFT_1768350 [Baffinella frigidus]|nr:hypothetical protein T484DRAFT_1768350 [Cryptophyta sp. CCMP2293]